MAAAAAKIEALFFSQILLMPASAPPPAPVHFSEYCSWHEPLKTTKAFLTWLFAFVTASHCPADLLSADRDPLLRPNAQCKSQKTSLEIEVTYATRHLSQV